MAAVVSGVCDEEDSAVARVCGGTTSESVCVSSANRVTVCECVCTSVGSGVSVTVCVWCGARDSKAALKSVCALVLSPPCMLA